jgi:hypothetical protein
LLFMEPNIRNSQSRIKRSAHTVRQFEPPLLLTGPSPQTLRCAPLLPSRNAYRFGAYAFHRPHEMTRGLWFALLELWPRTSGRFPDLYSDSYAAQSVDRLGATLETVAEAFSINPDSARKKVAAGRSTRVTTGDRWLVGVASGDQAAALLNVPPHQIASVPDHPESNAVQLRALTPDWPEDDQQYDALTRATRAIARGADQD